MRTEVESLSPLVRLNLPGAPAHHAQLEVRLAGEVVHFRTLPYTANYLHGAFPARHILSLVRCLRTVYRTVQDEDADGIAEWQHGHWEAGLDLSMHLDENALNVQYVVALRADKQDSLRGVIPVQAIPLLRRAFCALHTFWILKEDY